jgi:4'-phosphopantetheinyl transferase EntD
VIERLVPPAVAVVSTRRDLTGIELFEEEELSVARAVEKRRREFITSRACARLALQRLGIGPAAIPNREHGEPWWPDGVVGSITHTRGYGACAVAKAADVLTIGIDAERHEPLPPGVLEHVAFGRERATAAEQDAQVCLDRLLFSAKEAVYKAWFPATNRWLGFEDVELDIDVAGAAFRARLLVPRPVMRGIRLTELRGRWCVEDGIVATAVVVAR